MKAEAILDKRWISAHIPHQGSMCLLDEVLNWNEQLLVCRAVGQGASDHPLRAHGRLGSACAIEYAAQAVAVHGALLQSRACLQHAPRSGEIPRGMLASARAVQLYVERLDDISGSLLIEATRLHADAHSSLYAFTLRSQPTDAAQDAARALARGRLSLWLELQGPQGGAGARAAGALERSAR